MSITFNHNGAADGPGWDDAARGYLLEAADRVDRGEVKLALRLIEEAKRLVQEQVDS